MSGEHLTYVQFQWVDKTVSPWANNTILNSMDGLQIGETAPLEDVSNFVSESREYIGGLSDGDEFSVTCARSYAQSPNIQAIMKSFKGLTKSFRAVLTNRSVSPNVGEILSFDAVVLGWASIPVVGAANKLQLNFKISGGVTSTAF